MGVFKAERAYGIRFTGSELAGSGLAEVAVGVGVWGLTIEEWKRATLEQRDGAGVRLEGAILRKATLQGAVLYKAHLDGAYLRDAHLLKFRLKGPKRQSWLAKDCPIA